MPKQKVVPLFVLLAGFWTVVFPNGYETANLQRAATEQAAKEKLLKCKLQR